MPSIQIWAKYDRCNQVFVPKSGLLVKKLSSAILIKSVVVFASIRNSLLLSRWHDNLLLLCSKTVPLNGLAWLAGVWPATFSGTNKTDCSATWRAKLNYALVLKMEKFLKSNSVHGYLLHKMCIMHSALPEICTILYLVYTKRRTDAVVTIDGVLKSLNCIISMETS